MLAYTLVRAFTTITTTPGNTIFVSLLLQLPKNYNGPQATPDENIIYTILSLHTFILLSLSIVGMNRYFNPIGAPGKVSPLTSNTVNSKQGARAVKQTTLDDNFTPRKMAKYTNIQLIIRQISTVNTISPVYSMLSLFCNNYQWKN